jgi:spore germination protein YaaH
MISIKNNLKNHVGLAIGWFIFLCMIFFQPAQKHIISPLTSSMFPLHSLTTEELKNQNREVFGFLPHWNFDNAHNIDFETLTTLAYFDLKVSPDGNIIKDDAGYQSFVSKEATEIFKRAHQQGTRVVATLTLMDNDNIEAFLDDPEAQERTIDQAVTMVKRRGIDGINLDYEYDGNAGPAYRAKFTVFADNMTQRMHQEVPASKVTASVYASGVKYPKVQDIGSLSKVVDGIFMMGYDFAVLSSEVAMPTAPLYGHKEGKYWYDISTAVDDFLTVMPADKLILGTPWYGLNFHVYKPGFKAQTRPARAQHQTYEAVKDYVTPAKVGISDYQEGWDDISKVSWKAYFVEDTQTWRMVYIDDVRALGAKYDLAKEKNLQGVGMWALGFEGDKTEMWDLLRQKFGNKIADIRISNKPIYENM